MMMPVSVLASVIGALVRLDLAGQQLEQRGLARAVGADNADAVAALDAQGEVLDDGAVAKAFGNMFGRDDGFGLWHRRRRAASLAVPCGPSMAARWARISHSFSSRPWLRLRRAVTPRSSQCASIFSLASSLSAARASSA
jgi:hypothetical protein